MLRRNPRLVAALCFGSAAGLLTHFAWYPDARLSGLAPALTLAAALAHATGGAVTGRRLLDPGRTRSARQAALVGAATSLIALALFAPAMAAYVAASDTSPRTLWSQIALTTLTAFFAFLAVGWALMALSTGVAVVLYRLVRSSGAA